MGFEANLTPWVALDDGLPDFEGLFIFTDFETGIAGLEELAGGAVFDDGAALDFLRFLSEEREAKSKKEKKTRHFDLYGAGVEGLSNYLRDFLEEKLGESMGWRNLERLSSRGRPPLFFQPRFLKRRGE
jgi:hypothetical protein